MKRNSTLAGRLALSGAAAAALWGAAAPAWSLGLGRLQVQSALGEALRAEIDVTSLTPEEATNLQVRVAPPDSYRTAGVDYNPVLPGTRAELLRRADGRPFLRLTSDRGVQEPFVDVILEITWSTGRLVREYTLLFDPPMTARAPVPAAPVPVAVNGPTMAAAPNAALAAAATPAPTTTTTTTPTPAPAPALSATEITGQPSSPVPAPVGPVTPSSRAAPRRPTVVQAPVAAAVASGSTSTLPRGDTTAATRSGEPRSVPRPAVTAADDYKVRPGDSLSRIATRTQRPGVSLDQMLVSLYQANPQAFVGDNMNRLKSGAVLSVPNSGAANAIGAAEARQIIQVQSADFGAYRQRLASGALEARTEGSARQASGKVQAAVEDRQQAVSAAPDKLTLSKGTAGKTSAAEEQISKERAKKADDLRVAELSKNVDELKRLSGATAATATAAAPKPASAAPAPMSPAPAAASAAAPVVASAALMKPASAAPAVSAAALSNAAAPNTAAPNMFPPAPPAGTASSARPLEAPASAAVARAASAPALAPSATAVLVPAAASGLVAIASAPSPAASVAAGPRPSGSAATVLGSAASATPPRAAASALLPGVPAPPPVEEPSMLGSLLDDNSTAWGLGALAVVLLGGYGIYRTVRRTKKDSTETSFLESRLQPDSFFGASGGQHIDTRDGAGTSSSMSYSLSQLDAIGDVDPVAEADVYLAYGRDLQAEEILKEAMRSTPDRLAIRVKLLEVYAKRRDTQGFESLATQFFALTHGTGEDWAKVQELGAQLDPDNPLYKPGGAPANVHSEPAEPVEPLGASTMPQSVLPMQPEFSAPITEPHDAVRQPAALDLDLGDPNTGAPTAPAPLDSIQNFAYVDAPSRGDAMSIDFTLPDESEAPAADVPPNRVSPNHAAPDRAESSAFDLSDISLDLDVTDSRSGTESTRRDNFDEIGLPSLGESSASDEDENDDHGGDPLSRKLELAEEFRQIGDTDGARDLIHEVVAQSSGAMRTRAQSMLAELA